MLFRDKSEKDNPELQEINRKVTWAVVVSVALGLLVGAALILLARI